MNFLFRLKLTLLTTLVVCLAGVVRPQYPRPPPPHADHRYGPPPPPPHHHHPYHGQEEEHHEAQCALVVPGLPGKSAAGDRYAKYNFNFLFSQVNHLIVVLLTLINNVTMKFVQLKIRAGRDVHHVRGRRRGL